MYEFVTELAMYRHSGQVRPCVDAWDVYRDLGLTHDGASDDVNAGIYFLSLPDARRIVRSSGSSRCAALLSHLDELEKAYTGALLN